MQIPLANPKSNADSMMARFVADEAC